MNPSVQSAPPASAPAPASQPAPRRAPGFGRLAAGVIAWGALGLALATLLARALASHAWALDMFATFAPQAAMALMLLALVVALVKRLRLALCVLLIAGLHTLWSAAGRAPGAPSAPQAPSSATTVGGEPISILTFNSLGVNPQADAVIETIRVEHPRIAVILEASPLLIQKVRASAAMLGMYPHRSIPERQGEWNVIVLSAYPLEPIEVRDERWNELRNVYTYRRTHVVRAPSGDFVLAAVLPRSPRTSERWHDGNQMLARDLEVLKNYAAPLGLPIVVAADMNASPTSWRSAMAHRELGLARAKPLLVPRGTWPASNPPWLRVAIDDVLVSPGVKVSGWRTVERETGSDHVPVVVEVVMPARDARGQSP